MRATLADASLARYAGRFVWLELDFDKPANQVFLARHGVTYTPSLFVLDPADERATATQLGGLTLPEFTRFLDRGEDGVIAKEKKPADAMLAQGDALLGLGQRSDAIAAYRQALSLGPEGWPERERAVASFTWALMLNGEYQPCAETAAAEAPRMARGQMFARVVLSGLSCANQNQAAPWAKAAWSTLEPLAEEAISLPATLRDHRFQLYQQLMYGAQNRSDKVTVELWGDRWLTELDATTPNNDDERSALDVARVDAASLMEAPSRVIPALIASQQAMPNNYNASLRLAQMELDAKQYDQAVAACNRGLAHVTGPIGRSWLLQTKAEALTRKGQPAAARRTLQAALRSAQTIGVKGARERNVERISNALKEMEKANQ